MKLLTVKEAAEQMRVHPSTVYRLIDSNAIPWVEVPSSGMGKKRVLRIPLEKLTEQIEGQDSCANFCAN